MLSPGFPTLLQFAAFDRTITTTKADLTKAATELSTGQKQDLSRALGGQTGEFNLVKKALNDIEGSNTRLTLTANRFSSAQSAISLIRETVTGFFPEAKRDFDLGGTVGRVETQETAKSYLDTIVTTLNASYAGRRLFAGDDVSGRATLEFQPFFEDLETTFAGATGAAALDTAISDYFADGGRFDTFAYQGGTGVTGAVELRNGADIQNDVRATDPAFKDLLEGLSRIIFAPASAGGDWSEKATALLSQGEAKIISLEADLGRQQGLIDDALGLAEAERLILSNTAEELSGVDPYEAANRVQRLEVQLQSAFTMTARLSRLTLSNFL